MVSNLIEDLKRRYFRPDEREEAFKRLDPAELSAVIEPKNSNSVIVAGVEYHKDEAPLVVEFFPPDSWNLDKDERPIERSKKLQEVLSELEGKELDEALSELSEDELDTVNPLQYIPYARELFAGLIVKSPEDNDQGDDFISNVVSGILVEQGFASIEFGYVIGKGIQSYLQERRDLDSLMARDARGYQGGALPPVQIVELFAELSANRDELRQLAISGQHEELRKKAVPWPNPLNTEEIIDLGVKKNLRRLRGLSEEEESVEQIEQLVEVDGPNSGFIATTPNDEIDFDIEAERGQGIILTRTFNQNVEMAITLNVVAREDGNPMFGGWTVSRQQVLKNPDGLASLIAKFVEYGVITPDVGIVFADQCEAFAMRCNDIAKDTCNEFAEQMQGLKPYEDIDISDPDARIRDVKIDLNALSEYAATQESGLDREKIQRLVLKFAEANKRGSMKERSELAVLDRIKYEEGIPIVSGADFYREAKKAGISAEMLEDADALMVVSKELHLTDSEGNRRADDRPLVVRIRDNVLPEYEAPIVIYATIAEAARTAVEEGKRTAMVESLREIKCLTTEFETKQRNMIF